MAITFHCARCRKPYEVDDALAGKRARCKQCGSVFTIPASTSGADGPISDPYGFDDPYALDEETEKLPPRAPVAPADDEFSSPGRPGPVKKKKKSTKSGVFSLS